MTTIILSITIPLSLTICFILIQLFYSWKEERDLKKRERKITKEVDKLLRLDNYEMEAYHKN